MNHNQSTRDQLLHLLFGSILFVALAAIAVGLDLAASWIQKLGVSDFTYQALTFTAHAMLIVDLVLFVAYLGTGSYQLVKEMFK